MAKQYKNKSAMLMDLKKILTETWVEEADAMSAEELKESIIQSENSIEEQEKLQSEDLKLKDLEESVKTLKSAYLEVRKYQRARIKYCLMLLEEKGKI